MNDHDKNAVGNAGCGCGGGTACGEKNRWIWILLILAVAGVMIARNAERQPAPNSQVATNATSAAVQTPGSPAESPAQAEDLPRLVDLGAGKCIPCKMMAPILEDLKKTYAGRMEVVFIDVWEDPDAGKKYGINMIPTQIFYDAAGKELFRHEGFFGKDDILAKWKELGVSL
jgi:thioredoxin 1